MLLGEGARLGPYRIEGPLGSGAMGEVWAARDTRIDRDVAIKGLPADFAQDEERRGRFEREAKALAALSHPNVATLFGFEHHDGQPFLIMELVSGKSLAETLESGPLPWLECLPLFEQIAEGLQAAHSGGLVHRDLKPSNVMIDLEGRPKILDFGLARAMAADSPMEGGSDESPTLTEATVAGTVLGTVAYMAPEQARGKRVDHRADIWAWGCCLWEALSGQRPFSGDDVAMTLAAVLSQEPDWNALSEDLPASLRTLLSRCLDKDPRTRLQHIGEVRWWANQAREEGTQVPSVSAGAGLTPSPRPTSRWTRVGAGIALLLFGITTGVALDRLLQARPDDAASGQQPVRFDVESGGPRDWNSLFGHQVALTPDGRSFAYPSNDGIYLHSLVTGLSTLIRGTEGAWAPALSDNGQWLAFWRDGALFRIHLEGDGLVQQVSLTRDTVAGPLGVVWNEEFLLYGSESGLWRVAPGGEPENLLRSEERAALFPKVLPSGRILFTPALVHGRRQMFPVEVLDPVDGSTRQVGVEGLGARYLRAGFLTWLEGGRLLAASWQDDTASTIGMAVPVLDLDASQTWALPYEVTAGGVLVSSSGAGRRMSWIDASGRSSPLAIEPGVLRQPRWSKDGSWIAFTRGGVGVAQIFLHEVATGRIDRLADHRNNVFPVWTFDERIIFFDPRDQAIAIMGWNPRSEPEVLVQPRNALPVPMAVSRSGQLLFGNTSDILVTRLDQPDDYRPWLATEASEWNADFSPDDRWVAYNSDETGESRIYVRPFDGSAGRKLVSNEWSWAPSWSSDGRLLYFATRDGISAVEVKEHGSSLELSEPRAVIESATLSTGSSGFDRDYDPHPEGNGLVVVEAEVDGKFTVVLGLESLVEEAISNAETN